MTNRILNSIWWAINSSWNDLFFSVIRTFQAQWAVFRLQNWALYIWLFLGTRYSETAVEYLFWIWRSSGLLILEKFSYSLAEMYIDLVLFVKICGILFKSWKSWNWYFTRHISRDTFLPMFPPTHSFFCIIFISSRIVKLQM